MSCTTLLVGKSASYDGSTIIARNDDSGSGTYDPKKFVAVRPEDQPRHYRSVISHMEIDLPGDPCLYSIVPNVRPNRGVLAEAGVNEHNVAMSATETIAVNSRVLAADPLVKLVPAHGEPGDADYREEVPGGFGEEDIITLVLLVAALYLGQQVYDIVFVHDNVANFMHIVGGICGTGFGYFYALRPQKRRKASGAKPGLKFEKTSRHRSR